MYTTSPVTFIRQIETTANTVAKIIPTTSLQGRTSLMLTNPAATGTVYVKFHQKGDEANSIVASTNYSTRLTAGTTVTVDFGPDIKANVLSTESLGQPFLVLEGK